ncbi:NADPH-dependent FMN reductase [Deminuibacter soli]|uniref:NAD(P)H-dependent oxidoreductase n=1 Tax=Deminuibacter soli TaxID=2291815 RepID=A0A3E1NJG8_9BACT|nr:NADPH-dependent FMN reductase [Deminuibacter soli]RFM28021.1 NAD(P)H-dependent oxidoreductase [Deminuibacter soli]
MERYILAISGSLRARSFNQSLLEAVAAMQQGTDLPVLFSTSIGELPHFNPDINTEQLTPAPVKAFRNQVQDAAAVVVCTPEYAFGMPGVLKNALDWLVSSGEFTNKPTITISGSPLVTGGDKAHASLLTTLKVIGASIPEGGSISIPAVTKKIGEDGRLHDAETLEQLQSLLKLVTAASF